MDETENNEDFGIHLTYRDRTWGERPASFDSDKMDEMDVAFRIWENGTESGAGAGIEVFSLKKSKPKYAVWFSTYTLCFMIEVDRDQDLIDLLTYLSPYATASLLSNLLMGDIIPRIHAQLGDKLAIACVKSIEAARPKELDEFRRQQTIKNKPK